MSKILFIPAGIASGLIGGLLAKKGFDFVWSRFSDADPPEPEHREVSWASLVAALALQGAIFRAVRGVVEHGARLGFMRLTGAWPGEERPQPESA